MRAPQDSSSPRRIRRHRRRRRHRLGAAGTAAAALAASAPCPCASTCASASTTCTPTSCPPPRPRPRLAPNLVVVGLLLLLVLVLLPAHANAAPSPRPRPRGVSAFALGCASRVSRPRGSVPASIDTAAGNNNARTRTCRGGKDARDAGTRSGAAACGGAARTALRYSLSGSSDDVDVDVDAAGGDAAAAAAIAAAASAAAGSLDSSKAARGAAIKTSAGPPTLDDYSVDSNGRVVGVVAGHPTLADGDVIATSPLQPDFWVQDAARNYNNDSNAAGGRAAAGNRRRDTRVYREGTVVVTESGSRYRLGRARRRRDLGDDDDNDDDDDSDWRDLQKKGNTQAAGDKLFGIIRLPQPLSSRLPLVTRGVANTDNNSNDTGENSKNDDIEDDDYDSELSLPIMDRWRIQWNGRLMGSVLNHPVYDDGDVITTSALTRTQQAATDNKLREGDVVTTYSGSRYVLGRRMDGWQQLLGSIAEEATATVPGVSVELQLPSLEDLPLPNVVDLPRVATSFGNIGIGDSIKLPSSSLSSSSSSDDSSTANGNVGGAVSPPPAEAAEAAQARTKNDESPPPLPTPVTLTSSRDTSRLQIEPRVRGGTKKGNSAPIVNQGSAEPAPAPALTLRQRRRDATRKYNLTGQTAGRKRSGGSQHAYLISGRPFRTTSGKSNIYTAYIADDDGLPRMPTTAAMDDSTREEEAKPVAMKVSTNCEALKRESANYDRIISGGYGNRFVQKYEFIERWGGPRSPQSACALVIEAGYQDLKSLMYARGGKGGGGLDGPAMRDAALAAARCVEAMHKVDLVWTDIKPENCIVTTDSIGCDGDCPLVVKGIDLESAIPRGDTPVDYSPEASPPEFAVDFVEGRALDHELDFSYDVWSLGMLLYELSTGRGYFGEESPDNITRMLSEPGFKVDLRNVKRNRLRNLIGQCLQTDPKKRPSINEVLLHPYFLTTSLGWY